MLTPRRREVLLSIIPNCLAAGKPLATQSPGGEVKSTSFAGPRDRNPKSTDARVPMLIPTGRSTPTSTNVDGKVVVMVLVASRREPADSEIYFRISQAPANQKWVWHSVAKWGGGWEKHRIYK